jgi:flagellar assembly protein FliH
MAVRPKRVVFADKSPQVTPTAPAWLGKDPPVIAHRTQQRISLPPPGGRPSEKPRPPSLVPAPLDVAPPSLEEALPRAPSSPPVLHQVPHASAAEVESLAALRQALSDIGSLREIIFSQTERQLVELAVTIARQVIAHEISLDPGVLVGLAREGIRALDEKDKIIVKFGAALDDDLVHDFTEALRKDAPRCEVQIDPSLGPRECIVETELGRVDESVETRLYHVLEALVP